MTSPQMLLTPQRAALLAGHDNELKLLVRVQAQAPPTDGPVRQPLNLALVIDRSGSMSGRPLEEAKRCAAFIVDSLDADDTVSLVTYDDRVQIAAPFRKVGDRAGLHAAVRAITSGGVTALYDGWYEGAGQATFGVEQASVSRVLLLSDGQANRGLTEVDAIAARCAEMAEVGVTTSTYGLGHDFNEDLMVRMAEAGRGNSYYGQSAEDLMDPFREEFALLQALCARRLRLALRAPVGVTVEVLNRYARDEEGRWQLPDLAYGGEAWAAVRLRIPAALGVQGRDGKSPVLEAALAYEDLEGQRHEVEIVSLHLPWLAPDAYAAVASDPLVVERLGELDAADLQEQARLAARRGDWDRVDALLERALREAAANPWLRGAVDVLLRYAERRETQAFAKEAMYATRRLRSRLADRSESVGGYAVEEESAKAAFLRRKLEQGRRFDDGSGSPERRKR
jgi:Ca-activated chloride channel family protein